MFPTRFFPEYPFFPIRSMSRIHLPSRNSAHNGAMLRELKGATLSERKRDVARQLRLLGLAPTSEQQFAWFFVGRL
jgi:hypothetical protein